MDAASLKTSISNTPVPEQSWLAAMGLAIGTRLWRQFYAERCARTGLHILDNRPHHEPYSLISCQS